MRARLRALILVAILLLAGCGTPSPPPSPTPTPEPQTPQLMMLGLDGRWPFDAAIGTKVLADAHAPAAAGALVMGEARGSRALGDFVGLDAAAGARLNVTTPSQGTAILSKAFATRENASVGADIDLRSQASATPYVASFFEMERLARCAVAPLAKLCLLPSLHQGEARLNLRVDRGARDGAFLPDLVELGPAGRPAYWNGTFTSPEGNETPFQAIAPLNGSMVPAEFPHEMSAGNWTIAFTLETNGKLTGAAAAGIIRVREPGYLWFDDRLQAIPDPEDQAAAVIANQTPTNATVRVAAIADALPAGADIMLAIDDARALAGTRGVTGVLADLAPADVRAIDGARGPDALSFALRARPWPSEYVQVTYTQGDLVFAAPPGIDITALPAIAGARAPTLALASRAPLGEPAKIGGAPVQGPLLLLAPARGPAPWTLPAGSRWTQASDALENLSRSRTLALTSSDINSSAIATVRIETGSGNATRAIVGIGAVTGGPSVALWPSAAFIAGSGAPVAPRVILPLAPGADRADVAKRVQDAWAPFGVVLDR